MRLKHILKPTVAEVSPTATSEPYTPLRLKVVKTSKTGKSYNFYASSTVCDINSCLL